MAQAFYDSGWVPAASGAIAARVDISRFDAARVIFAASGSSGSTGAILSGVAGTDAPTQYLANAYATTPKFSGDPKIITGYSASNPGANASTSVILGGNVTGAIAPFAPMEIIVGLTPGAGSFGRVIVEVRGAW